MADDTSWMTQAACIGHNIDDWFDHPKTPAGRQRLAKALSICMSCHVRTQCLEWTLTEVYPDDVDDVGGVWGGTTLATRRIIRFERAHARQNL